PFLEIHPREEEQRRRIVRVRGDDLLEPAVGAVLETSGGDAGEPELRRDVAGIALEALIEELDRFVRLMRLEIEKAPARPQRRVVRRLPHRLAKRCVRAAKIAERARGFGPYRGVAAGPELLVARRGRASLAPIRKPIAFGERLGALAVLDRQPERGGRERGEQQRNNGPHNVPVQSSDDSRAACALSISCCTVASCNNNA